MRPFNINEHRVPRIVPYKIIDALQQQQSLQNFLIRVAIQPISVLIQNPLKELKDQQLVTGMALRPQLYPKVATKGFI